MVTRRSAQRKGIPIPVIFNPAEEAFIRRIYTETGITKADVIRRACRFALPKFISGEINLTDPSLRADPNFR